METACVISPGSDEKLWSKLRNRVESIVEDLKNNPKVDASADQSVGGFGSERTKRLREDSLLLLKGLDSVSSTLTQLSDTLNSAQKGVDSLANSIQAEEPRAKRNRISSEVTEKTSLEDTLPPSENSSDQHDENQIPNSAAKNSNLKKAQKLAVSMASKAAYLSKELKNIKSELSFMKERCNHLEEENRRLREEGYDREASHDDEDLLRLQLEALLAEKSRLVQENADLTRENRTLHQLVEYHQLTSQDISESFEEVEALYLDICTPVGKENGGEDEEETIAVTPID